jgi:hypothetical protein
LHVFRPDGTRLPWPHGQPPHRITPRPKDAPAPAKIWPYDKPITWPPGEAPPPGLEEPDELTTRRQTEAATRRRIDELIHHRRAS